MLNLLRIQPVKHVSSSPISLTELRKHGRDGIYTSSSLNISKTDLITVSHALAHVDLNMIWAA